VNELFDLGGDVAVVTGAGRGIGEGIAKVLAGAGARVVCAARREAEIERVASEIRAAGGQAIAVPTDVTDDAAVQALAQAAIDEWGQLDIWVNNAGGSPIQAPLVELDRSEWDRTLLLNLTAVWVCSSVASQAMGEGGRILNISSKAAVQTVAGSGHYAAAKAGVNSLTTTMAKELGPRVRVNCIMPGAVPTEIMMDQPTWARLLSSSAPPARRGSQGRSSPSTAACNPTTTTRGLTPTVKRGLTPAMTRGLTPTVARGLTPTTTRGLTPTMTRGLTPTVARGLTPTAKRGLTPAVKRGLTPAVETVTG